MENRLRELRKQARLSLKQVALLLGVSEAAVSRHETGQRTLSGEMLEKYAKLYKVEIREIFVPMQLEFDFGC